jgi:hypothetical protein
MYGEIHSTIVNCYLASASVHNTLPLSSVCQIYPDIHCHLPEKSQSSTAGNNGAPTSVPLSLGHALYLPIDTAQHPGRLESVTTYNPPSSFSPFACLFPKESKCSKWWNRNFINNQTLLILFILFHNCWNLQMCWMNGWAFENNVFTASLGIRCTTCHHEGTYQTPFLHSIFKTPQLQVHPLLNIFTVPGWLKC